MSDKKPDKVYGYNENENFWGKQDFDFDGEFNKDSVFVALRKYVDDNQIPKLEDLR